jgi:hypothetical protein
MKNLWGGAMRSDLVFAAMAQVSNRYMLTKLAAKATRKLHRPNTRIEDTTNDVLTRFIRINAFRRSSERDASCLV